MNPNDLQGCFKVMAHNESDCLDNWYECHDLGDLNINYYHSFSGNLSLMSKNSIRLLDLNNVIKK